MIATLAGGLVAQADPVLIVSDGVTTSGPITLTGGSGTYSSASFDSSWSVVVTTGESKPVIGSATNPNMELDIQATSLGSANPLTIILSDNNFGPTSGGENAVAQLFGQPIGGSGSDVIFNTYYDADNDLAGLSNLLTSSGTVFPSSSQYISNQTNSLSLNAPYSLTEVVQIDGNTAATYSLLANLQITNEACSCSLSFGNVPTNLTICQPMCQSCYQPYCQSSYQPYCQSSYQPYCQSYQPYCQSSYQQYCQPSYQQYCQSCQQYCQSSSQPNQIPNPVYEASLITATDSCLGTVPVQFLGAVTNQMCPTNGFCFITNGVCFFPNGVCFPTNGLCFPRSGICFITNGICCAAHNCSLNFDNCCLNGGYCFSSYGSCFQNYGNCYQGYGYCSPTYGNCSQSFGSCYSSYGNNCFGSYGSCSQSSGNCSLSNQCSTVITFTFGATNGCGLLQTVTQTVTVEHCQPCFKIGCSQPPQVCYPQPPQNCYPQQNCYPSKNCYPQYCYPQQNCYPSKSHDCYPLPQNCGSYCH